MECLLHWRAQNAIQIKLNPCVLTALLISANYHAPQEVILPLSNEP